MGRRAGVYVRISSDPNGQRLGVSRQLKECRAKAAALGWDVAEVYEDNDVSASGRKPRPQYRQMLADLEDRRIDAVIVWDLDRLTRRPIEVEEFIDLADRRGVALASVGGDVDLSTDNGRLFARIKGAVARSEVERKGSRQRSANDQRAAAGVPSAGRRAYGYSPDGLRTVPTEAKHLKWAADRILSGDALHSVTRGMNDRGARTTAGNPWSATQLRRTLQNPRYCGLRIHRGEVVGTGTWPALLDEGEHASLVALFADPKRHSAGPPRRYLLSGVATCGTCGSRVFGVGERLKGPLYRCETRLHINRQAPPIEDFVKQVIVARLEQPDAIDLVSEPADADVRSALRAKSEALRGRLDDIAETFAAGDIDRRQLTAATASLRSQLDQVTTALADQARTPVLSELLRATDVSAAWEALTMDRQRAVIDTLLTVRLHPPGRGARTFDPATVAIEWKGAGHANV